MSADAYKCLAGLHAGVGRSRAFESWITPGLSAKSQLRVAANYFTESAFPVLTPLAFDPGRPFPAYCRTLSLNLANVIRDGQGNEHFARIKVPDSLPPLVSRLTAPPRPKQKRLSDRNPIWNLYGWSK